MLKITLNLRTKLQSIELIRMNITVTKKFLINLLINQHPPGGVNLWEILINRVFYVEVERL